MKRALLALTLLLVVLGAVLVTRAVRLPSRQVAAPRAALIDPLPGAPERLGEALRIPTVSTSDSTRYDPAPFAAMHALLARAFPRVHATLRREPVGRDAVLYRWAGSDASLPPLLLMAHLDVVPVESGSEARWAHPPFGGEVAEGFVWGRGALDDKSSAIGIMEAAEALIASGFHPRRTVYLAFGADEEVGGARGARQIAALLRQRGIRPALVLDEGGVITDGIVSGIQGPVALIGIAEKGYLDVELSARDAGGHSSMPPRRTTVGRIGHAVGALEDHPMPARLTGVTEDFFAYLAPEMPLTSRVVIANGWLFAPLVRWQMSRSPSTNAAIRTTTAPTMLQGSEKENVLASHARAVVNFRLRQGDRIADVISHVRRTVDDPTLQIRAIGPQVEASPVSPTHGEGWTTLQRTIRQAYPGAVVAPYLMVGASDDRHFTSLTPNVYRFIPAVMRSEDLKRMHGTDERIPVAGYLQGIRFYALLVRNAAG